MLSPTLNILLDNTLLNEDPHARREWDRRYAKAGALSVDEVSTILRRLDDILQNNMAADKSYGHALYLRAWMHEKGQGGPIDYPAAIALLYRAIGLGHAASMHNRAWMHKDGQGGPIDYPAAAKLYYNAFILGQKEVLNPLIKLADDGKMDACFYLTLIGLLSEDQTGKNRAIS